MRTKIKKNLNDERKSTFRFRAIYRRRILICRHCVTLKKGSKRPRLGLRGYWHRSPTCLLARFALCRLNSQLPSRRSQSPDKIWLPLVKYDVTKST